MINQEELEARYAERAKRYAEAMTEFPNARNFEVIYDMLFLNFWKLLTKENKEPKFLEIGSGTSYVTYKILRTFPEIKLYYACDPNSRMIKYAEQTLKEHLEKIYTKINVEFKEDPTENILDEFKGRVDVALTHASLHHIIKTKGNKIKNWATKKRQKKTVVGMAKCLRPGGKLLVVDVPFEYGFKGKVYFEEYNANFLSRVHKKNPSYITYKAHQYIDRIRGTLDYIANVTDKLPPIPERRRREMQINDVYDFFDDLRAEKELFIKPPETVSEAIRLIKEKKLKKKKEKELIKKLLAIFNRISLLEVDPKNNSFILTEKAMDELVLRGKLAAKPKNQREFFEDIVAKHSITPHIARFVHPDELYSWLKKAKLDKIFVGVVSTPWSFKNIPNSISFVRKTFGLAEKKDCGPPLNIEENRVIDDAKLYKAIDNYLGYSKRSNIRWWLMYGYGEKPKK